MLKKTVWLILSAIQRNDKYMTEHLILCFTTENKSEIVKDSFFEHFIKFILYKIDSNLLTPIKLNI